MIRLLFILLTALFSFPLVADAKPYVCFLSGDDQLQFMRMGDGPQCHTIKRVQRFVEVSSLAVQVSAIYAACTGIGAPIAVYMEGMVLGLTGLSLIVGSVPCEDPSDPEQIKEQIKDVVCRELELSNVRCDPYKVRFEPIHGIKRRDL